MSERNGGSRGPEPGNPYKLTEAVRKAIVDSISNGVPRCYAVKRAGVNHTTFCRWLRNGKKSADPHSLERQLYLDVEKAHAEAVARNVELVQTAAIDTWQAAAWWLERRCPAEFGRDTEVVAALKKLLRERERAGTP